MNISVVLFDYNRDTFIRENISKLVNERKRIDFEIILIKSYKNEDIEKFLTLNNVKFIDLMENKLQSDYIKVAVQHSSGDLMLFLDDDDLFVDGKIEKVYNLFRDNPDLGYYHNNFTTIDENGKTIHNRNYKTPKFNKVFIKSDNKIDYFNRNKNIKDLLRIRPDFNSSSIAIRKEILLKIGEYEFNVRPDTFIMLSALTSDYSIMFDNEILTKYRIYSGNVSTAYKNTTSHVQKVFIKAFSEGIQALELYNTIFKNLNYNKYMKLRILNLQLAYNFWSYSKKYKINFKNLLFLLKIDFVHELVYYIVSSLPKKLKVMLMKIFYHTRD